MPGRTLSGSRPQVSPNELPLVVSLATPGVLMNNFLGTGHHYEIFEAVLPAPFQHSDMNKY
jgi:hypothetical protein